MKPSGDITTEFNVQSESSANFVKGWKFNAIIKTLTRRVEVKILPPREETCVETIRISLFKLRNNNFLFLSNNKGNITAKCLLLKDGTVYDKRVKKTCNRIICRG
jgi:midasin (ATPase involved in ribosome maturation)